LVDDELLVDTDTCGSRPALCDTVQVMVVPGTVKLVDARERPLLLAEVRSDVRTRRDMSTLPVGR
jgi:hypothetical protein